MANLIYIKRETQNIWTDSGGDSTMTLNNLAAGAARVGAQWDRGAGSVAAWFEWRLYLLGFATAPVVGEMVWLYFALSDGTYLDGDIGTSDAALGTTETLPNLRRAGRCRVETTTAGDDVVASGEIFLPSRYISPVVFNDTADNLEASNGHRVLLTPIPPEVQ